MNRENLEPNNQAQILENMEDSNHYDRVILPAETGARQDREGENFKHLPEPEGDLDTTGGYTVDREGLLNNYAVEPEMYYETPGDAEPQHQRDIAHRQEEIEEVTHNDETGKLTMEADKRGRGSGLV